MNIREQMQERIGQIKAEIAYHLETRPTPSSFTKKFRNSENERHFQEGRFSALSDCLEIITFFELSTLTKN
jgi:hypothetical protein